MLGDTRLEPDLDGLLWSFTNLFHRAAERVARDLDRNEEAQRSSQREQDGSEVKSVELERLTAEGITSGDRLRWRPCCLTDNGNETSRPLKDPPAALTRRVQALWHLRVRRSGVLNN
jgi:hypothetical protein